jgi:hypothetical protein
MVDRIQFETEDTGAMPPAGAQSEVDPNRPEWLDPKFATPEDQAKAYRESVAQNTRLAQELAALKKTPPADDATSEPEGSPSGEGDEKPAEKPDEKPAEKSAEEAAIEAAGLDFTPYTAEFDSTGDVTEENRAKIAEDLAKIPLFKGQNTRDMVDKFIKGAQVDASNDISLLETEAGGVDQLTAMREWAKDPINFSRDEAIAFNNALNSKDKHAAMFAVRSLRAAYEAKNSVDPARRLDGGGNPNPSSSGFRSTAEMVRAMQDPKYATDQAYRDEIKARIKLSNFT